MNRHFGLAPTLGPYRRFGPALCLTVVLAGASAWAAEDAQIAHQRGENDIHSARANDERPDAQPVATPGGIPGPAPEPQPESPPFPPEPPRADEPVPTTEPAVAVSAFVQGQDSQAFTVQQTPRKRTRTKAQARLSGLALMAARIATQAKLAGAGTFEAPRNMVNPSERRVLLRRPEATAQPVKTPAAPPPATVGVLDESIVKEIGQRKTMFRMCYESARRRGVTVTRADVRWRLSPDGSVRDVVVEVAQDEGLSRCIRVIASRPFPTTVPQEIPVAIPLLFVSER